MIEKKEILDYLDSIILEEGKTLNLEENEISNSIINIAKKFVDKLEIMPDLYNPTGRNSFQIEWHLKDETYIEFEMFEDKIMCMVVPYGNTALTVFPKFKFELPGIDEKVMKHVNSALKELIDHSTIKEV